MTVGKFDLTWDGRKNGIWLKLNLFFHCFSSGKFLKLSPDCEYYMEILTRPSLPWEFNFACLWVPCGKAIAIDTFSYHNKLDTFNLLGKRDLRKCWTLLLCLIMATTQTFPLTFFPFNFCQLTQKSPKVSRRRYF